MPRQKKPRLTKTPSYVDIEFTLRQQFRKASFRPHQREIIAAALDGKDIFVQAATSFGKSLCFQLPAVIDHGITIVVSPLLSLMINQVSSLRASGILASSLNSLTPPSEKSTIFHDLQTGHPRTRLLYVTPELCSTSHFRDRLQLVHRQGELARVAVDEAHCISEWGHDFRKDFKRLAWFRETFPTVPIMCLTATANANVKDDVLSTLGIDREPDRLATFTMSAFRPNLHVEIRFTRDEDDMRLSNFVSWLRSVYDRRKRDPTRLSELEAAGERVDNVPGIIYTISRLECESLATSLRAEGIGARPFHAGLPKDVKEETLAKWVNNVKGWDVIVATTAFGMGIDKDNVRFVVHWRLPKSFEGYYQEAGRAGRDGNAAYCFLYYSREDRDRVRSLVTRSASATVGGSGRGGGSFASGGGSFNGGGGGGSGDGGVKNLQARCTSLQALVDYCESTTECRHKAITRYFGEKETPECDFACDFHKDGEGLRKRMERGLASEEWVSTQMETGGWLEEFLDRMGLGRAAVGD